MIMETTNTTLMTAASVVSVEFLVLTSTNSNKQFNMFSCNYRIMIIIYNCCTPDGLVKPVVENSTTDDDSEGSDIDEMSFNDSNVVFNGVVCVL